MPIYCSRANVLILKLRLEEIYPGGLNAFRNEWPDRCEDDDLVSIHPTLGTDMAGVQLILHRYGLKPGRDYAITDFQGRPERLTDGIVFDRSIDIPSDQFVWRARAGEQESNVVSFPKSPAFDVCLIRGREYAPNLVILNERNEAGRLELSICVNPEGRLVFQRLEDRVGQGADCTASGWSCRFVRPENVPQVLVELMAERFPCEEEFAAWLQEKGIESELTRGGYEPVRT